MSTGEQRRDAGVEQVLATDSQTVGYGDLALAVIDQFISAGIEFTAEDIREQIATTDPAAKPHHPNVLPAVFARMSRAGHIVAVGSEKATRSSRHAGRNLVWRGA